MAKYTVRLVRKEEVAEGTIAFRFEKPPGFVFTAGQFCEITLLHPPETDGEGNTRAFSIASTPAESDIMIATRLRDSAFKRVLKTMPLHSEVVLEGPFGDFTLHHNTARPAVFLIGGIGITPVRSIVKNATEEKNPRSIFVFYSNRRPEDAPFLEEMTVLQKENPNYRFIATMTDMANSKKIWTGETGYISEEMIRRYILDLAVPIYYLVGPATMVGAMRKLLNDLKADPDFIRVEEYTGY